MKQKRPLLNVEGFKKADDEGANGSICFGVSYSIWNF
jgi:hypothetical protein